jgi:glutamate 5-kinase
MTPAEALAGARRLIVKIGSALLVAENGEIRRPWLAALADDVARCRGRGQEVILVSSGAIAIGRRHLGLAGRRLRLEEKQAAAATGQIRLAHAYQEALAHHRITVAQILLTPDDTEERRRHLNARATFGQLLALARRRRQRERSIATTRSGDNDGWPRAPRWQRRILVPLSDTDEPYRRSAQESDAEDMAVVCEIGPEIEAMAGSPRSATARGDGHQARRRRIAMNAGRHMLIAAGKAPFPLAAIESGRERHYSCRAASRVRRARRGSPGPSIPRAL